MNLFNAFKWKNTSMRIKLSLMALLAGVLILWLTVYFSNRFTEEEFEGQFQEKALLISQHILHDLEEEMAVKAHREIAKTLAVYKTYEEVKEIRVFDSRGNEVFAKEKGPPEPRVPEVIRSGKVVHYEHEKKGVELATYLLPLENKAECQRCHGPKEKIRGALLLSLSLERINERIANQNRKYFFLLGFITLALIGSTFLVTNTYLILPLRRLRKGTEALERGDFNHQIPLDSSDEIGELTQSFNGMSQKISTLFNEIDEKNKTLAEQNRLLSISHSDWRDTFGSITDQIAILNEDFRIIRANPAFRAYHSLPPDTEIQPKCFEVIGWCDHSASSSGTNCPHLAHVRNGRASTWEWRDAKKGKILEISLFSQQSSERMARRLVYIAKDISEKKESEFRLVMSERLAALGQMAAGIAHEIGNPLATISACSESLHQRMMKGEVNPQVSTKYLQMIREEVDRCYRITKSMLSFVRKTSEERKAVNLNEILEKSMEMLNLQERIREIEVLKNFQENDGMVLAHEGDLLQIFLAIIGNALEAMNGRGTLTLETWTHEKEAFVKVVDTGLGIPSAVVNRIFDPFFSTKTENGGTGLGLAIAAAIIKEYNGRIEVESQEGKGSVFKIMLPLSATSKEDLGP